MILELFIMIANIYQIQILYNFWYVIETVSFVGGIFAEMGDEDCTHLVVDDQQTPVLPKDIVLPHFIVRAEVLTDSCEKEWNSFTVL